MIPWIHLDTATVPGGGEFRLMQRGDEFWIMVGTNPLMTSRVGGSEEAMATLAAARVGGRHGARMLIGGLGMGFTLRAALAAMAADAEIVVAELVPAVVTWARGPLAPVFKGSLDDPRVTVANEDVGRTIGKGSWDAILLDVDNGPEGLSRAGNDRLYSLPGLRTSFAALREGGVLAIWSSHPDAAFTKRLATAGFAVDEIKVRANGARGGARHVIWMATKAAGRKQ